MDTTHLGNGDYSVFYHNVVHN